MPPMCIAIISTHIDAQTAFSIAPYCIVLSSVSGLHIPRSSSCTHLDDNFGRVGTGWLVRPHECSDAAHRAPAISRANMIDGTSFTDRQSRPEDRGLKFSDFIIGFQCKVSYSPRRPRTRIALLFLESRATERGLCSDCDAFDRLYYQG